MDSSMSWLLVHVVKTFCWVPNFELLGRESQGENGWRPAMAGISGSWYCDIVVRGELTEAWIIQLSAAGLERSVILPAQLKWNSQDQVIGHLEKGTEMRNSGVEAGTVVEIVRQLRNSLKYNFGGLFVLQGKINNLLGSVAPTGALEKFHLILSLWSLLRSHHLWQGWHFELLTTYHCVSERFDREVLEEKGGGGCDCWEERSESTDMGSVECVWALELWVQCTLVHTLDIPQLWPWPLHCRSLWSGRTHLLILASEGQIFTCCCSCAPSLGSNSFSSPHAVNCRAPLFPSHLQFSLHVFLLHSV